MPNVLTTETLIRSLNFKYNNQIYLVGTTYSPTFKGARHSVLIAKPFASAEVVVAISSFIIALDLPA